MIVQTIDTASQFRDAFYAANRGTQFSYDALDALFEFLEELTDEHYELDVVGLCCEYTEYADLEELMGNYDSIESLEDLHNNTLVLELDNGGLVIQDF